MADSITIPLEADATARWFALLPQLRALIEGEPSRCANLANLSAAVFQTFQWHWVGFYVVDVDRDELVLGPFQGPVACTRLQHGKGVCAAAWDNGTTQVVPDVELFPGHVACSAATRSEVVVPVVVAGEVVAVLDVDSIVESGFADADVEGLQAVSDLVATNWSQWSV
jgi:GAF domain-containing protein